MKKFWRRKPGPSFVKNIRRRRDAILHEIVSAVLTAIASIWSTIVWASGITGVITIGTIVKAVIIVGAVAYSYSQSSQKAKKAGQQRGGDFTASGHLLNTQSTSEPIPILYGQCRVGGNIVYVNATGPDNKYLHLVVTLSEGPVQGLVTDAQGAKIWLDDRRIQDFGSYAYFEFFAGSSSQNVCSTLLSADPNWYDAMRFTAYLYIRLEYNESLFASLPKVTAELKGRLLYDPRSGQTAYSANAALVAYDFLRSDRYSIGIPQAAFDESLIADAANWCDTNNYQFNGLILDRKNVLDNFDDIVRNFRAGLIWSEGDYKLLIYEYDTPVMSLTEDDIEADSFTVIVPGIPETPNRVIVNYIDAVDKYVSKSRVIENPSAILSDIEERDFEIDLIGTTTALQATKLGSYYVDRNRLNYQFAFVCHARALALEPIDMIQVTHSLPGWTNKILRVIDIDQISDGRSRLLCLNEAADLYDDVVNVATHNAYETNLPNPLAAPPNVIDVVISEKLYEAKNNILTKLIVSFSVPSGYKFFDHAELWLSENGADYTLYNARIGTSAEILNVKEKSTYYLKIVPVNIYGAKRQIADCDVHSHYVLGKTSRPSDVTSLWVSVSVEGAFLNWKEIGDPDVSYYEIRWSPNTGASWESSLPVALGAKGNSWWIPAAKPGKYLMKAVDTSGNYSANAATTIFEPADIIHWNAVKELIEDPTFSGTKTNMNVSGGVLYLTNGNTTGYYYSSQQPDLGYVSTARCSFDLYGYGINNASQWDSITNFDTCPDIDGDVTKVSVKAQIAISQNGIDWGDWVNFSTGDYIGRAFKFRIVVASTHVDQRYGIEDLTFYIDMPDRDEGNRNVTIPSTGATIEFAKPFQEPPRIWITIQNASPGDHYYLYSVTVDDFTVQIKNASGNGIQKNIDWQAKGY